jgi:hypothetical protein
MAVTLPFNTWLRFSVIEIPDPRSRPFTASDTNTFFGLSLGQRPHMRTSLNLRARYFLGSENEELLRRCLDDQGVEK